MRLGSFALGGRGMARAARGRPWVAASVWLAIAAIAAIAAVGSVTAPARAQEAPASAAEEIERMIGRLRASGSIAIAGATVRASDVALEAYERRRFQPLWAGDGHLDALLRSLGTAYTDGLDPESYNRTLIGRLRVSELDAPGIAELDLLATDALVRLSYDLRFGRVGSAGPAGRAEGADPFGEVDPAGGLLEVLASGRLERRLAGLRPSDFAYDGLRLGLSDLRALERAGGWPSLPDGPTMESGVLDARVPLLRRRLALGGDLARAPAEPDNGPDSTRFDRALEEAVRAFQHRHGLIEDGRVGRRTLRALNVPVAERIEQVRANLERIRRLAHEVPDTFVVVNVAGARVYMVRAEKVDFEGLAVVGDDETQTPVFSALMRYVDLNPTWTVPRGIVQEVLDAIRRDPDYLAARSMHVLDAGGRRVDPATIDFARFTAATFPYVFHQEAGPKNPLGRLKLMFPNPFSVYLHDSPEKALFSLERRLFSHGCIRLEDAVGLAVEVLDDPATWSRAALEDAIAEGRTRTIPLTQPLMVYVVYWTVEAAPDGTLHFYEDVYERDAGLLAVLDAR